jgi:hypothetical protein
MEDENLDDYQRDQLWRVSAETFYKVYYSESLTSALIKLWERWDEVAKFVIAITATTSVVSGWTLWNLPNFKIIWSIIAGLGAIFTILRANLKVPDRLRDLISVAQHLKGLRINLETFRYKMELDPNFVIEEFNDEFLGYRDQYSEDSQQLQNDIFLTKKRRIKVQEELDAELQNLFKD